MGNLKINDAEYETLATASLKICEVADKQIKEYLSILENILDKAVTHGNIYNCLTLFFEKAKKFEEYVMPVGDDLNKTATDYLDEINEKDQYLY